MKKRYRAWPNGARGQKKGFKAERLTGDKMTYKPDSWNSHQMAGPAQSTLEENWGFAGQEVLRLQEGGGRVMPSNNGWDMTRAMFWEESLDQTGQGRGVI